MKKGASNRKETYQLQQQEIQYIMETFQYGNITLTKRMIRRLFCTGEFPYEIVEQLFNVSCNSSISFSPPINDSGHTAVASKSALSTHYGRVVLAITAVIFVFGIVSNIGLVALLSTQKRFFKPSWYCVCNLVAADILVLLNMAAFVTTSMLPKYPLQGRLRIFLFPSLDMFLSSASMLSVAVIALDRLLSVTTFKGVSVWYRRRSKLFVKITILLTWIYCLALFAFSLTRSFAATSDSYNIAVFWSATVVAFLGAITVTAVCYLSIALLYVKHRVLNALRSQDSVSMTLIANSKKCGRFGHNSNNNNNNNNNNNKNNLKNQSPPCISSKKITKALWICVAPLPFLAGWCFYLGVQTYEMLNDTYLDSRALNMAMLLVPWAVSAFNPIMYFLTQRALRKELYSLFCKKVLCGKDALHLTPSELQSETITV